MNTIHSVKFIRLTKSIYNTKVPDFFSRKVKQADLTWKEAAERGYIDISFKPNVIKSRAWIATDVEDSEESDLKSISIDGKLHTWNSLQAALKTEGNWKPQQKPAGFNERDYMFISRGKWGKELPVDIRDSWGRKDRGGNYITTTFKDAMDDNIVHARYKLSNKKALLHWEFSTDAEKIAVLPFMTGSKVYTNLEVKAALIAEGGWDPTL
jgi:hypothetical protein